MHICILNDLVMLSAWNALHNYWYKFRSGFPIMKVTKQTSLLTFFTSFDKSPAVLSAALISYVKTTRENSSISGDLKCCAPTAMNLLLQ
jgi:hypothetical protein